MILASPDRFEMSKETANTLKEGQSLKGSLKVSAKYGPAVTIDASAEGSVNRNKEEVTKTATKFSQDVTDRTVKKVTERILQRQSTTTIMRMDFLPVRYRLYSLVWIFRTRLWM